MILGKITTLFSSMRGRPDLRPQHMEVRTRKLVLSLAGRTSFRHPRPEPNLVLSQLGGEQHKQDIGHHTFP